MMKIALKAADELAKDSIDAEVIDLRTVRPVDYNTVINSVKKTNRLVIVEESWPLGTIATEVAFKVQKEAFDFLDAPVFRVMGGDVPLPYAPTLIEAYLPNPKRVIDAVKKVMYLE
jgi:pyruvate dehydrogenase E1 component beta subunit